MKNFMFYISATLTVILGVVTCYRKSFSFRTRDEATEIEAIIIGSALILIGFLGILLGLILKKNKRG